MIERIKEDKVLIFLLAVIFLLVLLLVGRFAYSYLGPSISQDETETGEIYSTADTIVFSQENDLSFQASTDNFYVGAGNLSITANPTVKLTAKTGSDSASASYTMGLRIDENTYQYSTTEQTAELILTIKDENGVEVTNMAGLNYVTVGDVSGFDVTTATGAFTFVTNRPITTTSDTTGTTHTWTCILTFINMESDQSINETAKFNAEITIE